MKKKYWLIIGLLFAAIIAFGVYEYNKPSAKEITEDAQIAVTAEQLFKEFENNEEKANARFLNKVLQVSGIVTDVKSDSAGVTITLGAENPMFGVTCQLADKEKALSLKNGQKTVIKGLCTGFLMDVVLVKCSIIN